jgi:predicted peptidase
MAMLDAALRQYNLDADRVYLTGLSQGGHGAWVLAARHPERWAAIAPICGYGDPKAIAEPIKSLPVWCFHGDGDQAVPVAQSQAIVAAIKAAGGEPKLTIYPGVGHNSWDKAYRDEPLADWFLEHRRSAKAR